MVLNDVYDFSIPMVDTGHDVATSRSHLRRPTPEDWQRLQPRLVLMYKSNTADAIVAMLRAERYLITVKMLRDRLREWKINTKNRRPAKRRKSISLIASTDTSAEDPPQIKSITFIASMNASPEDVPRNQIMQKLSDWYDESCSYRRGSAQVYHADRALSMFIRASKAACDGWPAAWTILKNVGGVLCEISQSHIRPTQIVPIVEALLHGQPSTDHQSQLFRPLVEFFEQDLTSEHPLTVLLSNALHRRLSVETWQQTIALAESKLIVSSNETAIHSTRYYQNELALARARSHCHNGHLKSAEEVLAPFAIRLKDNNRNSGVHPEHTGIGLSMLGRCKLKQGHLDVAEELFSRALKVYEEVQNQRMVFGTLQWRAFALLQADRLAEAIEVLLEAARVLRSLIAESDDRSVDELALKLHGFRDWLQEEYAPSKGRNYYREELCPVIEEVEAISFG